MRKASSLVLLAAAITTLSCRRDATMVDDVPGANDSVARIEVGSPSLSLLPGETGALTVRVYNADGDELTGQTVAWISSDSVVASVGSAGEVTARFLGSAEIRAEVEQHSASVSVTVTTPTEVWAAAPVSPANGSETSVAISPVAPLHVAVARNFGLSLSVDGGLSWDNPAVGVVDPNVAFDHRGVLFLQGLGLGNPRTLQVVRSPPGALEPLVATTAYAPAAGQGNPDQGILAVDTVSTSPHRGNLYIVFSDYPQDPTGGCIGFCLRLVRSVDGGLTWSEPTDISDEVQAMQEHSSYITTGPEGEVYAAWWDLTPRVMFARSVDGGVTWEANVLVRLSVDGGQQYALSDDIRGNVTIDVDRSDGPYAGTIYISAMDQNGAFGGAADAWMVRSTDGGASWSDAIPLSDGPRGAFKYYFQPRISVAPNGRVDAVWYDTRASTSQDTNDVSYEVYYAASYDGGAGFENHMPISSGPAQKVTTCDGDSWCGQRVLYEYIGLASDDARTIAAWARASPGAITRVISAVVWHRGSE